MFIRFLTVICVLWSAPTVTSAHTSSTTTTDCCEKTSTTTETGVTETGTTTTETGATTTGTTTTSTTTTETGETSTGTTTTDTGSIDTAITVSASELSGEDGGCACSSGSLGQFGSVLSLSFIAMVARRRGSEAWH